ncbi:hypothetical protein CcaCcLH18_07585 [Colletotrichum camelliae]|nr:hypothetical protein CcaCcLH18_07585 [Colletotrichum camelliae]
MAAATYDDFEYDSTLVSLTEAAVRSARLNSYVAGASNHMWLDVVTMWKQCISEVKKQTIQRIVFLGCLASNYCEDYKDETALKRLDAERLESRMYIFMGHNEDHIQMALLLLNLIASIDEENSVCQPPSVDKRYTFAENLAIWGHLAGVNPKGDNRHFQCEKMHRALLRTTAFADDESSDKYWETYYLDYVIGHMWVGYPDPLKGVPTQMLPNVSPATGDAFKDFIESSGSVDTALAGDMFLCIPGCWVKDQTLLEALWNNFPSNNWHASSLLCIIASGTLASFHVLRLFQAIPLSGS